MVIVYGQDQAHILTVLAQVLGKPFSSASSFAVIDRIEHGTVVGIAADDARVDISSRNKAEMVAINTHCVNLGMPPDLLLSAECDFEFLYTTKPFIRRDLSRFVSFILGQSNHHEDLVAKPRTYFISTTFPDVRAALSNLDILSVGADAVELRVDLLEEPVSDGSYSAVPSLSYVGEQLMLLRQGTELPIIFTTRCKEENGRFPRDNPQLYLDYLTRAIKWGCEYIDVEIWLPEEIRRQLYQQRGNSKIISAYHDFSGKFKWPSAQAQLIFEESRKYGDIVKMITIINSLSENYELEYFRSQIKAKFPNIPLSAVNMGELGKVSRALNTVFSPITHPLLPFEAAPGQLSVAQINGALNKLGHMPQKTIYAIGSPMSTPQPSFFEKVFNELELPISLSRRPRGSVEELCRQPGFGGAYYPDFPLSGPLHCISHLTDAARTIGAVDTIIARSDGLPGDLIGDNATWKGILSTLTRDFAPSAYKNRMAILLSNSGEDAASMAAMFALRSLNVGKIYTGGFKARGSLTVSVEPLTSIESVQKVDDPFVIISALPPDKSHLVQPLLRHFSNAKSGTRTSGKVFLDLAKGPRKVDPIAVAEAAGWTGYGVKDTSDFTTVETLKLLIGQNVPYSFVRFASGI